MEAEAATARSWGAVGEKSREETGRMNDGESWDLRKERQKLDSGVDGRGRRGGGRTAAEDSAGK